MSSVLLTVLAVVLGLVVALVVILVVVPTQVWAAGDASFEHVRGEVRVRWGLGVLTFRLSTALGMNGEVSLFGFRFTQFDLRDDEETKEKKRAKKAKKKAKKQKKGKKEKGARDWAAWLRAHRQTLLHAAGRLLLTFDPRLRVSGRIGLGDPADTAVLFEILRQLEARSPERVELAIEREWLEEELDIQFRFVALIWPLHLLLVVVALLFEPRTWRMLRAARA